MIVLRAMLARRRAWLAALLAGALLAGCATPQRIAGRADASAFDRTGRFAVTVEQRNGKHDAVQGGFAWRDTDRRLVLDLANPLGNTLARVEVGAGRAVLTRSNGSTETAGSPDELVEQALGSPIPVAGLRDWLRGRLGGSPAQGLQQDAQGRPERFQQSGWRVSLSRYDDRGPRLLQLRRSDYDRDISVRLAVDGP